MALRVGVVGGGQLARMMIAPAVELGVEIRVLAEDEGMSAALAATAVGDYRDADTVLAFARDVDVITFDHEHVPQDVLAALIDAGVAVHPGPEPLGVAQDKLVMRARMADLGLPQPDWAAVADAAELQEFLDAHGGRAVVKTPRGGYDGKGVRVVSAATEADDWFAALAEDAGGGSLLVEELVDFTRELAQQVARRPSGDVRAYPVVETVQRGGVCAEVIARHPAPTSVCSGWRRRSASRWPRGWVSPACSPSSSSRPPTSASSSTSSPCDRTTAGTGRRTVPSPASSNSTCAPCSTCRSGRRRPSRRGRS